MGNSLHGASTTNTRKHLHSGAGVKHFEKMYISVFRYDYIILSVNRRHGCLTPSGNGMTRLNTRTGQLGLLRIQKCDDQPYGQHGYVHVSQMTKHSMDAYVQCRFYKRKILKCFWLVSLAARDHGSNKQIKHISRFP